MALLNSSINLLRSKNYKEFVLINCKITMVESIVSLHIGNKVGFMSEESGQKSKCESEAFHRK